MTKYRPSWETLNAFVDGELSTSEESRIKQAIEHDSDVAKDVAELRQAKLAVSSTYNSLTMNTITLSKPSSSPRRSSIFFYISAMAACLLMGVLLWQQAGNKHLPIFVKEAYATHLNWLNMPKSNLPINTYDVVKTGSISNGMFIPDLSDISLQLEHFESVMINEQAGIHLGYLGSKGCVVSLVSWPAEQTLSSHILTVGEGDKQSYFWQVGEWHYIMFASRMPLARRALTAHVLYDLTLKQRLPSVLDQQQLLASRAANPPCLT